MTYQGFIDYINDNRLHISGVGRLVIAIAARLLPFKKKHDLIPCSQLEEDAFLSHRGTKLVIQKAIKEGYINRDYVCGHCHASFGEVYDDIHHTKCPVCGRYIRKNIWQRISLSQRGYQLLHQLGVILFSNDKEYTSTLPQEIITFSKKVADLLNCSYQWELLAQRIVRDKPTEQERELALAYMWGSYKEHKCGLIMSLPALFSHALGTVKAHAEEDKYRYAFMTKQDKALIRIQIKQVLEGIGVWEASSHPDAEKMRLDLISYVYLLYREYPNYAHVLDELTKDDDREPRTLARRKVSMEFGISNCLTQFRKTVLA